MFVSFNYEELISKVRTIQNQTIGIEGILHDRSKKKLFDELKTRSLTIIDPYGNPITNKYFDHELISDVIKKFKKNYIPKYLQSWIRFSTMKENRILPLNDCELKSTVANYPDNSQFITYGQVTVWYKGEHHSAYEQLQAGVLLMDNMEKIKMEIFEQEYFTGAEFKLCMNDKNMCPNGIKWDKGLALKLEDTIMSSQLYQQNSFVMVKLFKEMVKKELSFILHNSDFIFSLLATVSNTQSTSLSKLSMEKQQIYWYF
jgi:hypothetical protein